VRSRAVILVLKRRRFRKAGSKKEVGGWCNEPIAGITARTTSFPGLITLAKISTAFSLIVGLIVRMRSENSC
jgi:hypothetical protein